MSDVPVHLLNSLVVFARARTIEEAARVLGITQPALSKQLRQLEERFPERLFAVHGRKKILTPFGRRLSDLVEKRLGNIQEVVKQAKISHSDPAGAEIRILARQGVLDRFAGRLRFKGSLYFSEASNETILDKLEQLKAEVGITHGTRDSHEIVAKPLFKEGFSIVVPHALGLAPMRFGRGLLANLMASPVLGYKREDEILLRVADSAGFRLDDFKVVRAVENYTSIAEMVTGQLGWAILPSYLAREQKRAWAVAIPEAALPPRRFSILYRRELSKIPWFKELIEEIAACFE